MKSKIKNLFTANLLFKLAGLILSILLWLILTNVQDPSITRTITVPIVYDETWLSEHGYIATYKPSSVTLQVQVRRSNSSRVSAGDFSANASMQEYLGGAINEAPRTTKINLVVTRASNATYIENWSFTRNQGSYVEVIIDTVKSGTYEVNFAVSGEMPEGYTAGDLASDPVRVRVTGPTSAFSNLAAVKAVVDLSRIDPSDNQSALECELHMYDGNDRMITNTDLAISQETVMVSVGLNQTKEIGISVASYYGEPAEGYGCSRFDYSPKIVEVTGTKAALAGVSTVSIPRALLDISGATESMSFAVGLDDYLPANVSLSEGEPPYVEITCEIEKLEEETFEISTDLFSFAGIEDYYDYEMVTKSVPVVISSFRTELDAFTPEAANLSGTVNVTGLQADPASRYVPVSLHIDPQYRPADDIMVEILISERDDVEKDSAAASSDASEE